MTHRDAGEANFDVAVWSLYRERGLAHLSIVPLLQRQQRRKRRDLAQQLAHLERRIAFVQCGHQLDGLSQPFEIGLQLLAKIRIEHESTIQWKR